MTCREVVVLIPSHSLEDFPTELGDKPAEGLLNAFSVVFHPALLAATGRMPGWHRSDEPPSDLSGMLIVVPTACDDQIPHGWVSRAREEGAAVVSGETERQKMMDLALTPLLNERSGGEGEGEFARPAPFEEKENSGTELTADLVADFHALGTCWLLMELLTRHMHHFSSYDEVFFEKTVLAAAKAAVEGDEAASRERLQACFDLLIEARERFYPVDCYLLDLCLIAPDMLGDRFGELLSGENPVNLLLKASDAQQIAEESPETVKQLAQAWSAGRTDVAGGDYLELPAPMIPLESALLDLKRGRAVFKNLFNREPTTWGRRRFGVSVMQPQLLHRFGYHSALHFLLDDGIYPDREQSRMPWESCDSSSVDAFSRIPLPADSPTTWLRFPERMAETMESDQVAALALARWPETKSPFFEDIRRMQKYAPVLGRFVTFEEYFLHSDDHGGGFWGHESREYLSPFFVQAVARRESHPISRFRDHFRRVAAFEAAAWQHGISVALMGRPVDDQSADRVLARIDELGPDVYESSDDDPDSRLSEVDDELHEFASSGTNQLTRIIMHRAQSQSGWLCINTLSFLRRVVIDLPEAAGTPAVTGPVKAVQVDGHRRQALVEIPAAGFAWFPTSTDQSPTAPTGTPLADGCRLQNEFFEVFISESTGGLQRIKPHGRSPNRLSQQLAYRFPREMTVRRQEGDEVVEETTWYSEMKCQSVEVTSSGPACGEIVTAGELTDPTNGNVLAGFRQTFRVWRGRPFLEMDIELLGVRRIPEGDPWSCFYGSRFAWNDSTAALSQSVFGAAQPVHMQRIESPDYLEIASEESRTTILPMGLPFHRKTGPRMVDSILVVDGEPERRFQFVIAIDQNYPQQAARDALTPVVPVSTETGPPRAGETGWFYHLDSRCVQVSRVLGLMSEPVDSSTHTDFDDEAVTDNPAVESQESAHWGDTAEIPDGDGFALRLQETEGKYQSTHVELFRTPTSARLRDFRGTTTAQLTTESDGVRVEMSPFTIADLEIRFD